MDNILNKKKYILNNISKFNMNNGSTENQIEFLTKRINNLQNHFKVNRKDNNSRRGLILLVSKRKKILNYLKKKNINSYLNIIETLKLRKN